MPTYRTQEHRTDRILKDWILKERLAFNLESSLPVAELQEVLPEECKQQLGELKPTDNIFRKMSSGFNKVSDVWIELMRFVGVQDFSPEQAILGTVSTFLDSENARVKLNASYDAPHRKNSIEVLCLNEPTYQGLIRYEGERLSFPPSIFEAVIDRRLSVYSLYCENLSDVLLIPFSPFPQSLLVVENNARLAQEHRGLDQQPKLDELDGVSGEDAWMDSDDAELEATENEEVANDDDYDHNQYMDRLLDEETADNPIIMTPEGQVTTLDSFLNERTAAKNAAQTAENETEIEGVDDTDADAEIEAAVDGHGSEIDGVDGEDEDAEIKTATGTDLKSGRVDENLSELF